MLESEAEATPKARFRFGFTGKQKRTKPPEHPVVTSDDILDSLTRQAATQVGLGEQETQSLELLTETEEQTLTSEPIVSTIEQFRGDSDRNLGNYFIVLMCVAGMILVWLYSGGRDAFGVGALDNILIQTNARSVFANPFQIGVISVAALLTALWVAIRRRAAGPQIRI